MALMHWINTLCRLMLPLVFACFAIWHHSPVDTVLIWAGWLAFLLLVAIGYPIARAEAGEANAHALRVLWATVQLALPLAILLYKPSLEGWQAWLYHNTCITLIGLVGGLLLMVLAGKGVNQQSSWKTFGGAFVLIVAGLFIGCVYPFAAEYIRYLRETDPWSLWYGGAMAVVAVAGNIRLIKNVRDGKISIKDGDSPGPILLALFGYLLATGVCMGVRP
jgi:hypothetical protein